jgi:hypothetical protein
MLIGDDPDQVPTNADLGRLAFQDTIPTASTTVPGVVKVDGTTITINNGVISAAVVGGTPGFLLFDMGLI